MGKSAPIISDYAWRKPPKDIEWHYVINQVKYVEELIDKVELAYDSDLDATIPLLARYYRNYKGFSKEKSENLVYEHIEKWFWKELDRPPMSECSVLLTRISHACSNRRYKNCHGYKPLRDFDGINVTVGEIETIKQLDDLKHQELLFCILCFTKMYNETNRRQGRKVNNLYYVDTNVLRRCCGWKKNEGKEVPLVMQELIERELIGIIDNKDKYAFLSQNRQPICTEQCKIVDDDSEVYLYIDNFDTLGLTWQFILGNSKVKKCECGRYFQVNSNAQKKCPRCGYANPKPKKKKKIKKLKKTQ